MFLFANVGKECRVGLTEELTDDGTIYSTSCQDISAIPAEVEAVDGLDGAALTDTFFQIFQPFGQIVS